MSKPADNQASLVLAFKIHLMLEGATAKDFARDRGIRLSQLSRVIGPKASSDSPRIWSMVEEYVAEHGSVVTALKKRCIK